MGASAQKVAPQVPTKPINLDRELEEQVKPNRAVSYYHFSLAKWNEDKGELPKAISEMRTALNTIPAVPQSILRWPPYWVNPAASRKR